MHPIVRYRRAKGLTQGALGREVGVTTNAVQAWERGTLPRPMHMPKLAQVLGVDALTLQDQLEAWRQENLGKAERAA